MENNKRPVGRPKGSKNKLKNANELSQQQFEELQNEHIKKLDEIANKFNYDTFNNLYNDLSKDVAKVVSPITNFNFEQSQQYFSNETINKANNFSTTSYINKSYNPMLAQQYNDNLFTYPRNASPEQLQKWLNNPNYYYKQIQGVAELVRNSILQYKRVEDYFSSILSFKSALIYIDDDIDKITEKQYLKSKKKAINFLDRINPKFSFSQASGNAIRNGTSFYLIKKDKIFNSIKYDTYISFVPLPSEYCYITGYNSSFGYSFGIDLSYFTKLVNMEYISPELYLNYKPLIEELEKNNVSNIYIPIQPQDGFALVADMINPYRQPLLSGLLSDAMQIKNYKDLVKRQAILQTWFLIPQSIPLEKDSGKPKVSYQDAEYAIQKIQSMLPPGAYTFSTPLEVKDGMTMKNTNSLESMLGISGSNFWSASGVASTLFGEDVKNSSQLEYSSTSDFLFVSHLYEQINNIVNLLLEIEFKGKKWKVNFYGNAYKKKEEFDNAMKTFTTINAPIELISGDVMGDRGNSWDLERLIKMGDKSKIKDILTPLVSMYQNNGNTSDDAGRPKSDNPSDATELANANEANENRMV